jgi:phosphodiesterase/alkaline phosphatase D-like protein
MNARIVTHFFWKPAGFFMASLLFCGGAVGANAPVISHGPLLGEVTSTGVRVWARTNEPATIEFRYGKDSASLDGVSEKVQTESSHDFTGWTTLQNLSSDTEYVVQVFIDGNPIGVPATFRTLPDSEALRDEKHNPRGLFNFSFTFGSCANQNPLHGIGPSLPTYTTLLDQHAQVDFQIMNGDWLYEELRTTPVTAWAEKQGVDVEQLPEVVRDMPSIVGVWENYKLYLDRGTNLSRWHRTVPGVFTFDDHELVNDIWGAGSTGRRNRRAVFRDIGTRAWLDYLGWANPAAFPHSVHHGQATLTAESDILVDPEADFTSLPLDEMLNLHVHWGTPEAGVNDLRFDDDSLGDPNSRVYEIREVLDKHRVRIFPAPVADGNVHYSIGRRSYGSFRVANCEFFLLDTRGARQMHDTSRPHQPNLTMLGMDQRKWLMDSMDKSDADFFFVVSSVPFMIPHRGAGGFEAASNKEEAWTAFLDERKKLIAFWDTLKRPVFVMTGDLHNSFAIQITDRVWEFCSGPHNSVNHVPSLDEDNRPATGIYNSGGQPCDIRWSTYVLEDLPRLQRLYPHYLVVQVNNVFNMPQQLGGKRLVSYPHPQVIFQYHEGRTGKMVYAESVVLPR